MGRPPKPDARKVDGFAAQAEDEIAAAKRKIHETLGETDGVSWDRAMGDVLATLEKAHLSIRNILDITAANAVRGPYKDNGNEGNR